MCLKKNLKDKRVYQWRSTFHLGINEFRYTISYALCMRRLVVIKFIMNLLILNLLVSKIQHIFFTESKPSGQTNNGTVVEKRNANVSKCHKGKRTSHGNRKKK